MKNFYTKVLVTVIINAALFAHFTINFSASYETFASIMSQIFFCFISSLGMLIPFLPLWIKLKKKRLSLVEFGTPFYGILTWMLLTDVGFGNVASLSNVIEMPAVFFFSVFSTWLETLFNKKQSKVIFYCSLLLPIVATFFLRAIMPTLPE